MKIKGDTFLYIMDYILERVWGPNFWFAGLNLAFVLQFLSSLAPASNAVVVDIVSAIMFSYLIIILLACVAAGTA